MKKFLNVLLLSSFIFSTTISVSATEIENQKNESQSETRVRTEVNGVKETLPGDPKVMIDEYNTQIFASKSMTIKKNYNKISDIPNSVYYEEYNDKDKKWYSGDLKLTKYELIYSDSTTKIYQATFTGTIKS